jgi:hypothetical protein
MPVQTYFPDGSLMFDSDAVRGGICVGIYEVPSGQAFSRSFPLLAGATLRVSAFAGRRLAYRPGSAAISINNAGTPSVSAAPVALDRVITIWADGSPAIQSGAGLQALNDQGVLALSPAGRGLVYIGKATYATYNPRPVSGGLTEPAYWHITISSPTRPVAVVDMSNGIRLYNRPGFVSIGSGVWRAEVIAVADGSSTGLPPSTLVTPDVYCFAVPAAPGSGGIAAIYDEDGTLAYDLLAGRMLYSAAHVSISPSEMAMQDLSVTRSVPVLSKPGLLGSISYQRMRQRTVNSATTHEGVWTMASGQLIAMDGATMLDTDSGTVSAGNLAAASDGAYAEIIDLSAY